jgi:hypothetical protein
MTAHAHAEIEALRLRCEQAERERDARTREVHALLDGTLKVLRDLLALRGEREG